jgi:hypothetical protein
MKLQRSAPATLFQMALLSRTFACLRKLEKNAQTVSRVALLGAFT